MSKAAINQIVASIAKLATAGSQQQQEQQEQQTLTSSLAQHASNLNTYSIFKEVSRPTTVEDGIRANFTHPHAVNLVLARGTRLEVYTLRTHPSPHQATLNELRAYYQADYGINAGKESTTYYPHLHESQPVRSSQGNYLDPLAAAACQPDVLRRSHLILEFSQHLHGRIAAIRAIRFRGYDSDALLIAFSDARLSVLGFDRATQSLVTLGVHSMEEAKPDMALEFEREIVPHIAVHPEQSAVLFTAFDTHLWAFEPGTNIPLPPPKPKAPTSANSDMESSVMSTETLPGSELADTGDMVDPNVAAALGTLRSPLGTPFHISATSIHPHAYRIKDVCFLSGFSEPTALVLTEQNFTWAGRYAVARNTCALSLVAISVSTRSVRVLAFIPDLPHDSEALVPLPAPLTGALLISSALIFYIANHTIGFVLETNDQGDPEGVFNAKKMPSMAGKGISFAHAHVMHLATRIVEEDGSTLATLPKLSLLTAPPANVQPASFHSLPTSRTADFSLRALLRTSSESDTDYMDVVTEYANALREYNVALTRSQLRAVDLLVCLHDAKVMVLTVTMRGNNQAQNMTISKVGEANPPAVLCQLTPTVVFLGSRLADSLLVEVHRATDEEVLKQIEAEEQEEARLLAEAEAARAKARQRALEQEEGQDVESSTELDSADTKQQEESDESKALASHDTKSQKKDNSLDSEFAALFGLGTDSQKKKADDADTSEDLLPAVSRVRDASQRIVWTLTIRDSFPGNGPLVDVTAVPEAAPELDEGVDDNAVRTARNPLTGKVMQYPNPRPASESTPYAKPPAPGRTSLVAAGGFDRSGEILVSDEGVAPTLLSRSHIPFTADNARALFTLTLAKSPHASAPAALLAAYNAKSNQIESNSSQPKKGHKGKSSSNSSGDAMTVDDPDTGVAQMQEMLTFRLPMPIARAIEELATRSGSSHHTDALSLHDVSRAQELLRMYPKVRDGASHAVDALKRISDARAVQSDLERALHEIIGAEGAQEYEGTTNVLVALSNLKRELRRRRPRKSSQSAASHQDSDVNEPLLGRKRTLESAASDSSETLITFHGLDFTAADLLSDPTLAIALLAYEAAVAYWEERVEAAKAAFVKERIQEFSALAGHIPTATSISYDLVPDTLDPDATLAASVAAHTDAYPLVLISGDHCTALFAPAAPTRYLRVREVDQNSPNGFRLRESTPNELLAGLRKGELLEVRPDSALALSKGFMLEEPTLCAGHIFGALRGIVQITPKRIRLLDSTGCLLADTAVSSLLTGDADRSAAALSTTAAGSTGAEYLRETVIVDASICDPHVVVRLSTGAMKQLVFNAHPAKRHWYDIIDLSGPLGVDPTSVVSSRLLNVPAPELVAEATLRHNEQRKRDSPDAQTLPPFPISDPSGLTSLTDVLAYLMPQSEHSPAAITAFTIARIPIVKLLPTLYAAHARLAPLALEEAEKKLSKLSSFARQQLMEALRQTAASGQLQDGVLMRELEELFSESGIQSGTLGAKSEKGKTSEEVLTVQAEAEDELDMLLMSTSAASTKKSQPTQDRATRDSDEKSVALSVPDAGRDVHANVRPRHPFPWEQLYRETYVWLLFVARPSVLDVYDLATRKKVFSSASPATGLAFLPNHVAQTLPATPFSKLARTVAMTTTSILQANAGEQLSAVAQGSVKHLVKAQHAEDATLARNNVKTAVSEAQELLVNCAGLNPESAPPALALNETPAVAELAVAHLSPHDPWGEIQVAAALDNGDVNIYRVHVWETPAQVQALRYILLARYLAAGLVSGGKDEHAPVTADELAGAMLQALPFVGGVAPPLSTLVPSIGLPIRLVRVNHNAITRPALSIIEELDKIAVSAGLHALEYEPSALVSALAAVVADPAVPPPEPLPVPPSGEMKSEDASSEHVASVESATAILTHGVITRTRLLRSIFKPTPWMLSHSFSHTSRLALPAIVRPMGFRRLSGFTGISGVAGWLVLGARPTLLIAQRGTSQGSLSAVALLHPTRAHLAAVPILGTAPTRTTRFAALGALSHNYLCAVPIVLPNPIRRSRLVIATASGELQTFALPSLFPSHLPRPLPRSERSAWTAHLTESYANLLQMRANNRRGIETEHAAEVRAQAHRLTRNDQQRESKQLGAAALASRSSVVQILAYLQLSSGTSGTSDIQVSLSTLPCLAPSRASTLLCDYDYLLGADPLGYAPDESALPESLVRIDSNMATRHILVKSRVQHVVYHAPTHTVAVAIVNTVPSEPIEETTDRSVLPTETRYSIIFYDASTWRIVSRFENFEENESVVCMTLTWIKGKSLITCGVAMHSRLDTASKGKIVVLEPYYAMGVSHSGERQRFLKLHHCSRRELQPVTSICAIDNLIAATWGQRVMLYDYDGEEGLIGKAFYDCDFWSVGLRSVRNLLVVADLYRNVQLLVWDKVTRTLQLLGKAQEHFEAIHMDLMFDNGNVNMVISDVRRNVQFIRYLPTRIDKVGRRLFPRADIHAGTRLCHFLSLRVASPTLVADTQLTNLAALLATTPYAAAAPNILRCRRDPVQVVLHSPSQSERAFPPGASNIPLRPNMQQTMLYAGTQDGHYVTIAPIDEATYRRLDMICALFAAMMPHSGGLNPRQFRLYKGPVTAHRDGAVQRCIADGTLLEMYLQLDLPHQLQIAQAAGVKPAYITDALLRFELATQLYPLSW